MGTIMPGTVRERDAADGAERQAAVVSGALGERPFPRLLLQLLRKRLTGRLVVTDESGDESQVYLRDGAPVHVERPNDLDRLSRVVVDAGLLPAVVVASVCDDLRPGQRFGQVLVDRRLLTPVQLAEALKIQLRRKIVRLFFARRGRFEIYLGEHPYGAGDEFTQMRLDPRCLIYPGIRAAYDESRLKEELAPLAGRAFRLVTLPPNLLGVMGFPQDEPTLTILGERSLTLNDLPPPGGKPIEARASVLALLYTDLLETSAAPVMAATNPDAGPAVPDSLAAPGPAPAPAGDPVLRARIETSFAQLGTASHFALLGVAEDAKAEEVSAAYLRTVRQIHPDRLASLGLRDLAEKAERVVARLGEAQAVLLDPARRAEYVASRSPKRPSVDSGQAILAAEENFQKGAIHLRRRDHARAVECFAAAMAGNSLEPLYRAHWMWARFVAPGADQTALAREALQIFDKTLAERPKAPQVYYWSGLVHKVLGDAAAAEKAFRTAVAQDKNFLDAEREVRLIEMRKTRASQPMAAQAEKSSATTQKATGGGILGRILKR